MSDESRQARMPEEGNPIDRLDDAVPTWGYQRVPLVAIGVAREGRSALHAVLASFTRGSGLALAIAFRPSPAAQDDLAWLEGATMLPLRTVSGRVRVEPDTVYVAGAGKMLISHGLFLDVMAPERPRGALPVDHLFRSVADAHGPHAVAVVLPGDGDDGAIGIKRVKERGGLTIVLQRLDDLPSEMVEAAIATTMVDWALPAQEMMARIAHYCRLESRLRLPPESESGGGGPASSESTFRAVLDFVSRRTGRDLRNYKRATTLRRLGRRLQVNGVETLEAYLDVLQAQPGEAGAFLQDMLVSVTNFFRDQACFAALEGYAADLFVGKQPGDSVRVWVLACATGEEAYSLAMMLVEQAEAARSPATVQVFASDLDAAAIRTAREGLYPFAIAADVSPQRLDRFFVREARGFRVRRELRERVLFAVHDGLRDPPFSRIDLASCRNLLIYLSREAQTHVFETLRYALTPTGLLFLGASETVDDRSALFSVVDKKHRIYMPRADRRPTGIAHRAGMRWVPALRPPLGGLGLQLPALADQAPPAVPVPTASPMLPPSTALLDGASLARLHLRAIDHLAPASVLLSQEHGLLHVSSKATRYLQYRGGEPTQDLVESVLPQLRSALRAALHLAADLRHAVHTPPVDLGPGPSEAPATVSLTVQPLDEPAGGFLVLFREGDESPAGGGMLLSTLEDSFLVQQLERETQGLKTVLRETVEQYQTALEEVKASNEELQAMNEELHSATEELETGREELQSINEEHITVNQELKAKVDDLGQSNSDMQNLMDATAIPTVFLDREFRLTRFTPSTVGLFKLIGSDTGRPLTDLTTSLEYPQLLDDARRVLQTLSPSEREVEDASGNGYLARVRPYRTLEDRIAGVVLSFIDISERKRAQESLRQSQERFSAIVNQASVGVVQTRLDGAITFANICYQDMLGYALHELVGRSALSLLCEEDRPATQAQFERLASAAEPFQSESRSLRKDGSLIWLHKSVTVLTDEAGRPDSALIVCTDVSERKFAEDALRSSEERLRLMLENAVDYAIFSLDLQRRVTSWNAGAQRLLGYSEEEILGRSGDIIFTAEDRQAGAPQAEEQLARREGRAADDRLHQRKDGSQFWASGAMMPMHNAQGATIGLVKILRDQSEQRAAQQELEQNRSELIAALAANEGARKALEAADVAKDQFLAVLSHELRNPLSSIAAASEVLAPERLVAPDQAHAAHIIRRQAAAMKVLLDDLLDVSSLRRGKLVLRKQSVDARVIAEAAVEATQPLMIASRHVLTVDVNQTPIPLHGDAIRLTQVLSNLLANAARYTPPGGRISLAVRREDDSVVFEVSDNGIGMEPAAVNAMFGMFTQGQHVGEGGAGGGLGIGLALARSIVGLHGGSVAGESAGSGQGSRFTVKLPVGVAPPVAQDPSPPPPPVARPAALRLLLADDNEDALWSMARMLSLSGHEVRTAASGPEALEAARDFRPDVAVLDIGMPGLDGHAVARRIRASDWGHAMFLIAATGWGRPEDKRAAYQAGFDHHLVKPVAASAVQDVLREWQTRAPPGADR